MTNRSHHPWIPLLLLALLAGCGDAGDRDDEIEIGLDSEEISTRPGVILSDTSLGTDEVAPSSEALPGPGDLPAAPLPTQPGGGSTPAQPAPAPPAAQPAQARPAAPPVPAEGWMTGTARRGGGNLGVATLMQVRSARNDGFDRIVFQFAGPVVPGYTIAYIDEPVRQCGSGDVVPMPGDGWLSILMEPAQAHDEQGRPTVQQRALSPGLPNVIAINSICDFEAQVEWVAGVRSPEQFRISELRDPARLVVDIRH